ncbi:MAG: Maf family nucleotide pyrophosphatase [Bacteroidales bacterium]|nr:Maf family nucleotide pyrophosphatase [Bacteroidales bacterium]
MAVNKAKSLKFKILLASASPRRQELLSQMGFDLQIVRLSTTEETYPQNLFREEIAVYLAEKKAGTYNNLQENEILITADTIVWMDGKVLGKPENYSDAFQMLKFLSGKKHYVLTGVCLKSLIKTVVFHAETMVKFAELSDEEIRFYIENYKPYDKAGAYGIQEWIGKVGIEYIEGSYYNVVGLPVQRLYRELLRF